MSKFGWHIGQKSEEFAALQTCFLHFNGFIDIGVQYFFHLHDLLNTRESYLARSLNVLCLLDKNTLWVF